MLSVKSETIHATGKMKPCHRPSQKPGAAGATAPAAWVAAQPASASRTRRGARRFIRSPGRIERGGDGREDRDEADDCGDRGERAVAAAAAVEAGPHQQIDAACGRGEERRAFADVAD